MAMRTPANRNKSKEKEKKHLLIQWRPLGADVEKVIAGQFGCLIPARSGGADRTEVPKLQCSKR